jgi:hypothetical protein
MIVARLRRRRARGEYLAATEAEPLLVVDPLLRDLNASLSAEGYTLQHKTRPYVAKSGLVTIRFVWRRRGDGRCATFESVHRLDAFSLQSSLQGAAQ